MDTALLILYLVLILFLGAGGGRLVIFGLRKLARLMTNSALSAARVIFQVVLPEPPQPNYRRIALLEHELSLTDHGMTCWRCGRVSPIDAQTPCLFCGSQIAGLQDLPTADVNTLAQTTSYTSEEGFRALASTHSRGPGHIDDTG